MRTRWDNRKIVTVAQVFIFKWRFSCRLRHHCWNSLMILGRAACVLTLKRLSLVSWTTLNVIVASCDLFLFTHIHGSLPREISLVGPAHSLILLSRSLIYHGKSLLLLYLILFILIYNYGSKSSLVNQSFSFKYWHITVFCLHYHDFQCESLLKMHRSVIQCRRTLITVWDHRNLAWVKFVASLLCSERFLSRVLRFPHSPKTENCSVICFDSVWSVVSPISKATMLGKIYWDLN